MSLRRGGNRERRVPERMCVACRTRRAKASLIRVARLPDGSVVVDETGKGPGRGAYVCARRACWQQPDLVQRIGHVLKTPLGAADRARLVGFTASLRENSNGG